MVVKEKWFTGCIPFNAIFSFDLFISGFKNRTLAGCFYLHFLLFHWSKNQEIHYCIYYFPVIWHTI